MKRESKVTPIFCLILLFSLVFGCTPSPAKDESVETPTQEEPIVTPTASRLADEQATTLPLSPSIAPYTEGSPPVIEQSYEGAIRGSEPADIVLSPDGEKAYVPVRNTDNLLVIDLPSNQIIDIIDLFPASEHPLGPAPEHIAITPDGSFLLVTTFNDDGLAVINTETNDIVKILPLVGGPRDVAVSPDGRFAYVLVACRSTLVQVIDMDTFEAMGAIPTRPGAQGQYAVTFSDDGERAYMATEESVVIFDTAVHTVLDVIQVPQAGPMGDIVVSSDKKTAFVTSLARGKVIAVDLENRQVADAFSATLPLGLALSDDDSLLYAATWTGQVLLFDTQSGKVTVSVELINPSPYFRGSGDIEGLVLSPDESILYAASIDSDGVYILDASTLEPLGIILANTIANFEPIKAAISPDGAYLYVASGTLQPSTVSIIDAASQLVIGQIFPDYSWECKGQGAGGLDVSPDGNSLYILSANSPYCLLVADPHKQAITAALNFSEFIERGALVDIAVLPDGKTAYVLEISGDLFEVDLLSLKVVGKVETNIEGAWTIKLSPDSNHAYVAGTEGFVLVDLLSNTVEMTGYSIEGGRGSSVPHRAVGVNPDGSNYLIGEFDTIQVYDAKTNAWMFTLDQGEWEPGRSLALDITFSSDGGVGYLAMWDSSSVIAFDANSWELIAQIDTGRYPHYCLNPKVLLLSPDDSTLFAICEESDNVVVIDTTTHQIIEVLSLVEWLE